MIGFNPVTLPSAFGGIPWPKLGRGSRGGVRGGRIAQNPRREAAAEAKRKRKAEKRVRDANASKQGARDSYEAALLRSGHSPEHASRAAWSRFYEDAS